MKKFLLLFTVIIMTASLFGQAKQPSIMIFPSDVWCKAKGFWTTYDDMGTKKEMPDYKQALQTDPDLALALTALEGLMFDRGFPPENLLQTINDIEQSTAEDNMTTSKSGADFAESPLDKLKKRAKADISMYVGWTLNQVGPKKELTFIIAAYDAYTNKLVAEASGPGPASSAASVPVLLKEAVLSKIDEFNAKLQTHFERLFEIGREVSIEIKVFDDGLGIDLETEYDGYELTEIIDDWMADNTVAGRHKKADASENFISYKEVRIPLYDAKGRATDTQAFVRELGRYLKSKYNIPTKVMQKGLGSARLVIGEK